MRVVEPRRRGPTSRSRREEGDEDLPPALAALVEERRAAKREAAEAAVRAAIVALPPATWREIQDRAASVGVEAELLADGSHLHLATELPALENAGSGADVTALARGQGLVEYGLILAISTAVLTAVWLVVFGGTVSDALTAIGIAIDRATGG